MQLQRQSLKETIQLINSDMHHRCEYENKKLNWVRYLAFITNEAVLSQIIYRIQIFFYTNHLLWIAYILESLNRFMFTVSIDCKTSIGPGFFILHPSYINIQKNVTIGKNCILAQQNCIGPSFTLEDETSVISDLGPVIGDNVFLGVGCVIFGNVSIGSNSKVFVNSAVDKSFPEDSILVGIPAKNRNLS